MAEKNGLVPVVAKELRPHAIWTLIMWIAPFAGSAMITALFALLQKARHVSLDWFIIGGLFVLSIGVLALLLYLAKELSRELTQQHGVSRLQQEVEALPARTVLATPLSSAVPADVLGDVVTPTAPASIPARQVNAISFPAGTVSLFTYEVPVGNVQDVGTMKIEVREIRKNKSSGSVRRAGEGDYGAVLYVGGGGLIWGGERVTEISTNCYYLPLNPIQNVKEPYSIYSHHFGETFLRSFAVYLEHINPHSGVVTMKACEVRS
jgi:hypothetical protein